MIGQFPEISIEQITSISTLGQGQSFCFYIEDNYGKRRATLRPSRDEPANFLASISPFIENDGARNMNEISRRLHIPYQTLRFRLLNLRNQGITVAPIIDESKLDLSRFRVSFDLSDEVASIQPFFDGLHQNAGLKYFARSMNSNTFDCEFLIPRGKEKELDKLMQALQEMNLIENPKVSKLQWKEFLKLRTEHYDYENASWDIDFDSLAGNPSHSSTIQRVYPEKANGFDHLDLEIIKCMEIDPWIKLVDLAIKLQTPTGNIAYHMNNHVVKKKLIKTFKLKWTGSKDAWSKHTLLGMVYVFNSLSEESMRHAMSIFTAAPFVWNHMKGDDGLYMAELLVPVSFLPDTLHYLSENLRKSKLKPDEILYPDWSASMNYTLPYLMHTEGKGWELSAESCLGNIIQMIKTVDTG